MIFYHLNLQLRFCFGLLVFRVERWIRIVTKAVLVPDLTVRSMNYQLAFVLLGCTAGLFGCSLREMSRNRLAAAFRLDGPFVAAGYDMDVFLGHGLFSSILGFLAYVTDMISLLYMNIS